MKVAAAVVAGFAVIAAIALITFGIRWITADPKGRLGVREQNLSATNRIEKQEMFEQLYADIGGYRAKVGVARAQVKAHPDDRIAQTNLAGVQQQCIDTVQQYNAEARKVTSRDWRSTDLPAQRLDLNAYCPL